MSPTLTTLPPGTKAEIIRRVLAMKHPKLEKAPLAAHFGITLGELHTLLNHHGFPNVDAMRHHVQQLEDQRRAAESEDLNPVAGDTPADDSEAPAATDAPENARGKLTSVKVARLAGDPRNLRDHLPDIEDLAATIKEAGLLQPILVRTDGPRLVVVDGHRRLAAIQSLRWTDVDVIIRPSMKTSEVLAAMLITSNQRADLDPIEEARGLMRLKVERGCTDSDLATVIGRTQAFVSNRLALLNLTPEQQEEVRAGNMKLVEAQHHGRMNAGTVSKKGVDRNWHLGPQHTLANRVKARCTQAGHPKGRTVGGMGCGACWEQVIRADERVALVQASIRKGTCDTCGGVTATDHEGTHQ